MLSEIIRNVHVKHPIVHNITNYVTAADCANITLTVGASPIMADEPLEVSDVTSICDALVLNTGTISGNRLEAMLIAGTAANKKGIPVILDPVGAGVSSFRTEAINKLIAQVKPQIIRLNTAELKSLCLSTRNISGIDASNENITDNIITFAQRLSVQTHAVIGVSGISDIITDGTHTAVIHSGHSMMRRITGAGCMLSAVTGAFAAANSDRIFDAVTAAFAVYGKCGQKAYKEGIGTASYKNRLFDEMTNPDTEEAEIEYR